MAYVPKHSHPQVVAIPKPGGSVPAITVHALKENKRPIGFAPWPKPKPKRKPRNKAA